MQLSKRFTLGIFLWFLMGYSSLTSATIFDGAWFDGTLFDGVSTYSEDSPINKNEFARSGSTNLYSYGLSGPKGVMINLAKPVGQFDVLEAPQLNVGHSRYPVDLPGELGATLLGSDILGIPIPATFWLLWSGLLVLIGFLKRTK